MPSQPDELMTWPRSRRFSSCLQCLPFGDLRLLLGLSLRRSGSSGGGTSRRGGSSSARGGECPSMLRA